MGKINAIIHGIDIRGGLHGDISLNSYRRGGRYTSR